MPTARKGPQQYVSRKVARREELISGYSKLLLEEFGLRFREARVKAGLSQMAVLEDRNRGAAQSYISKVELGKVNLTMVTMVRLSELVGLDLFDLLKPPETLKKG